ncbi:MAG TPA: hypothetical protein VEI74_02530 [Candidatus Methylomirabilis sp.]|nr:hypothetical protein [Candidatus Methylomirabilis sp.]
MLATIGIDTASATTLIYGLPEQAYDLRGDVRRMQVGKGFAYFGDISGFERGQHAVQMIRLFVGAISPW